MKIKTTLISFLIISSFVAYAQVDSLMINRNPASQFEFVFSSGLMQKTKFSPENSTDYFKPTNNHVLGGQISYVLNTSEWSKVKFGFKTGVYSFNVRPVLEKSEFPVLESDFDAGSYNIFNDEYDNIYYSVPYLFSFRIFNNKKHRLWFDFGLEAYYESKIYNYIGYQYGFIEYQANPDEKIKFNFLSGIQYRYQLKNYHELIFGLSASFIKDNGIKGRYVLLQDYNQYKKEGGFHQPFNYLSFDMGYSINPKKLFNKKMKFKIENRSDNIIVPDTVSNKHELRFGFNTFFYTWINIVQNDGEFKPYRNSGDNFYLSFSADYLLYFKKNIAFSTGIDVYLSSLTFNLNENYTFNNQYNGDPVNMVHIDNSMVKIPIGINYIKRVSEDNLIEAKGEIGFSFNSNNSLSTISISDNIGNEQVIFRPEISDLQIVSPVLSTGVSWVHENRQENKWVIGFDLSYFPVKKFDFKYSILQNDYSYEKGYFSMKPLIFNLHLKFAFTSKKRRFLNSL